MSRLISRPSYLGIPLFISSTTDCYMFRSFQQFFQKMDVYNLTFHHCFLPHAFKITIH
jgi:hypothetical protein